MLLLQAASVRCSTLQSSSGSLLIDMRCPYMTNETGLAPGMRVSKAFVARTSDRSPGQQRTLAPRFKSCG